MDRSRILRRGGHRFSMVLEESVLRYRMGDPEVMAGRLGHLPSTMSLPNVSAGDVPFAARRLVWPLEAFTVHKGTPEPDAPQAAPTRTAFTAMRRYYGDRYTIHHNGGLWVACDRSPSVLTAPTVIKPTLESFMAALEAPGQRFWRPFPPDSGAPEPPHSRM